MSKQDRTHSRTPADTENKFLLNLGKSFAEILGIATDARKAADSTRSELSKSVAQINKELTDKTASIELLVSDGKVKGEVVVGAINGQSSVKISADKLDITGKTLDIKVDATNINGTLTADQINADGMKADNVDITGKITAKEGEVGGWALGEAQVPFGSGGIEYNTEMAMYSGEQREDITGGEGEAYYQYETWLTASGVTVRTQTVDPNGGSSPTIIYHKTWRQILLSE